MVQWGLAANATLGATAGCFVGRTNRRTRLYRTNERGPEKKKKKDKPVDNSAVAAGMTRRHLPDMKSVSAYRT